MGNGPHSQTVTGVATNELTTPSVKRAGLHSPFFASRTIFLATDVAMELHDQRYLIASKLPQRQVMAAMSSRPNAVLISRRMIGISLAYRCESEKLPVAS
jgi:hypothetical protein